ncbi:MAG: hypothetical protein ACTHLW_11655 [Verrucomicrobiota bacterium]
MLGFGFVSARNDRLASPKAQAARKPIRLCKVITLSVAEIAIPDMAWPVYFRNSRLAAGAEFRRFNVEESGRFDRPTLLKTGALMREDSLLRLRLLAKANGNQPGIACVELRSLWKKPQ